jgi:hypothetical protein
MLKKRNRGDGMRHAWVSMAVLCAAVLALNGQQAAGNKKAAASPPEAAAQTPVTKSRSNIKNNLAVVTQNPNGSLKCVAGDQPCTKEQVKALSEAATGRTRFLKGNVSDAVATLELGSDGSLVCTTADGKKCASAQVTQLNSVAAAMPAASDRPSDIAPGTGGKPK